MGTVSINNNVDILEFSEYVVLSCMAKGIGVSPLKLQKLLYYIQSWHLVFFSNNENELSPLFPNIPEAWVNGPVYPDAYKKFKKLSSDFMQDISCETMKIDDLADASARCIRWSDKNLHPKQVELIEQVLELYAPLSQAQLVMYTHCEKPWCEKREGLSVLQPSKRPLSLKTMYTYYLERYENRRK